MISFSNNPLFIDNLLFKKKNIFPSLKVFRNPKQPRFTVLWQSILIHYNCGVHNICISANIGPRSGPGSGKKASYGSGKQTLRLRANGPAQVEEIDDVRSIQYFFGI